MSDFVRRITRMDIKGPTMDAHILDDYRNRVIALKNDRRVIIGDRVELVFDNRLTLQLQIEETCRLENLTRDDQIEEEIKINNELMPTQDSLAATLFIPLPQDEHVKDNLRALVGLDEHVILHIGPHAIRAAFEPGRSTEDRISAVQYTRYPLSPEAKTATHPLDVAVGKDIAARARAKRGTGLELRFRGAVLAGHPVLLAHG